MADTYNGWTNRETWLINLWIGDHLDLRRSEHNEVTAEYVEGLVQDLHEDVPFGSGLYEDLINHALAAVNWHELAEAYTEEPK